MWYRINARNPVRKLAEGKRGILVSDERFRHQTLRLFDYTLWECHDVRVNLQHKVLPNLPLTATVFAAYQKYAPRRVESVSLEWTA